MLLNLSALSQKIPPYIYLLLTVAVLALLKSIYNPPKPESAYHWIFQTSANAGDDFFLLENQWAERVYEASKHQIKITLLPAGSVVQYNETLEAVGANIIQGHITDPSYFSGKDPAFAMLGNLVGAWSAPEEMLDFIEHGGGKELFNNLVNPYGLQFIGASATGLEAFLSNKPIHGVADLKGLKLRAPEGMVQEVFAAAGASPVNLPGSEVYTALEKGVIEAADYTVFSTNHALGMHRFASYPIYPGFHSMPLVEISMHKATWDELPQHLQQLLTTSVTELSKNMINDLHQKDLTALAAVNADSKISVIDWPPSERAKFRRIAQTQWESWAARSPMSKKVFAQVSQYLNDNKLLPE